jgi:hypothetical protein
MSVQQLTLATLEKLDMGKAAAALQEHLKRAAIDCMDRPGDGKARKVTLQFDITPIVTPDLTCDEVHIQIQAASKVPTHRTKVYSCGLRKNGMLVFNPDSPDNVNQNTLLDGDDD